MVLQRTAKVIMNRERGALNVINGDEDHHCRQCDEQPDQAQQPIENFDDLIAAFSVDEEAKALEVITVQARGLGEFQPADIVDGNSSWNRRVELIVQSDNSSGYQVVQQLGPSIGR